jgi:mono/diheme cytochrome c family protein
VSVRSFILRNRHAAIVSAFAVASAARAAAAQTTKTTRASSGNAAHRSSKPAGPSTLDGVYTDEQASRGKDVYAGSCRSCHSPMSHTGATFNKWWRGKPLSDLFTFVSTRMPKNDPGSLAPEDVADVVAYLLKMNAMPVGAAELPPDADSLKRFRIEAKPKSGASTTKRAYP